MVSGSDAIGRLTYQRRKSEDGWQKERLTMFFEGAPYTILKDERLGVALSVERVNTPADAIPIMYDHPNYATRLEVDTRTPLESTSGG